MPRQIEAVIKAKGAPDQVLSTYTVIEHTLKKANNSLKMSVSTSVCVHLIYLIHEFHNFRWIIYKKVIPLFIIRQVYILKNINAYQPRQAFHPDECLLGLIHVGVFLIIIYIYTSLPIWEPGCRFYFFCNGIHFLCLTICPRSGVPIVSLMITWCTPSLDNWSLSSVCMCVCVQYIYVYVYVCVCVCVCVCACKKAQLFSTLIIIKIQISIVVWFLKDHVTLTGDWSNGCWKLIFAITWINNKM